MWVCFHIRMYIHMAVCSWCVCVLWGRQKTIMDVSHDCSLPYPLRQDLSFNLEFSNLVKLAPEIFLHLCISGQSWDDRQHVWSYDIYVGAEDSNLDFYACAVVTLSTGTPPTPHSISLQWSLYPQAPPPLHSISIQIHCVF